MRYLVFAVLVMAVMVVADLETMEVETRDVSENHREKRQWQLTNPTGQVVVPGSAVVPQVVMPSVVVAEKRTPPGCYWSGTSPFCFGSCSKHTVTVRVDRRGNGLRCVTGTKKLCCPPNVGK